MARLPASRKRDPVEVASELIGEDVLVGLIVGGSGHISETLKNGSESGFKQVIDSGVLGERLANWIFRWIFRAKTPQAAAEAAGLAPAGFDGEGFMYMALGRSKLAFFSMKETELSRFIDKLLIAHPRNDVVEFKVRRGLITRLEVVLVGDTRYLFDVHLNNLGKLKELKTILSTETSVRDSSAHQKTLT